MSKKKQLQLLLTPEDEESLSRKLTNKFPDLCFLDDKVWKSVPVVRESIQDCTSYLCYLYRGSIDALPTMIDSHGRVEGPGAGMVIQILRPRLETGVLRSGSIGTGYDPSDLTMDDFVRQVWSILKQIGSIGVVRPDGRVDSHYLLGDDARRMSKSGRLKLRDRSVEIYYSPT